VAAIADCEIVVIMRERTPFTRQLFDRLPNLKLLITSGMRNAAIDLAAARERDVLVCGTASSSEPPAELTWALILGLARQLVKEHNSIRSRGPWQSTVGLDLYGRQLGLLGLGKIGSRVARVAQAFGMNVMAWSQNLKEEQASALGVKLATSKSEVFQSSDIVSIHLVLGERTRNLVGEAELKLMKKDALLINTSRPQIVDERALQTALRNNWIAGAGIDVFVNEPLPVNDPWRDMPNVLATPHLGYVTGRNYSGYFKEAVEDIEAFLAGKPVRVINP
jgi:phosphoglycerate dehydrogenase-like enzyme